MTERSVLRVKRWEEFQHYRDRDPVWIKVYGRLLDDADFLGLPEAAQAQLVKLWLVASRCRNQIRDDVTYLKHALHSPKLYIDVLVRSGFLERVPMEQTASTPASVLLAKPEHDASPHARPRARGEGETETETEKTTTTSRAHVVHDFLGLVPPSRRLAWESTLDGWREGLGYIAGRRATEDDIVQGITEYLAATPEPDYSPRHVVTFVHKAEQRRTKAPTSDKPTSFYEVA